MRIGIDARELSKPQAGGFRSYLAGLLHGFAEVDEENEYILYIDRPLEDAAIRLPRNTRLRIVGSNRLLADWTTLRRAIREDRPDVMHFPCNYGLTGLRVPTVISLLDCICLKKSPSLASAKGRLLTAYSAYMTRQSVPAADVVVTISEYSREQMLRYFPGVRDRAIVTRLAGSVGRGNVENEAVRGFDQLADGEYVLLLASIDPRKNAALVFGAFAQTQAAAEGCRLAVVCSHPSAVQMVETELRRNGFSDRAVVLTDVNNTELWWLYRNSLAFVFASLEEGFGLPPLEAMGQGCPVISSDASSMPEVLGDAALYFDPLDAPDLAAKIDRVRRDPVLREALRAQGRERAAGYAWSKTAEQTLNVYYRAVRDCHCQQV